MLVYHPAFDIYHAVLRFLKILSVFPEKSFQIEHLKLIDYFVVFPNEVSKITIPLQYREFKKRVKYNKYENVANGRIVFQQLQGYQDAALQSLASYSFIEPELFKKGIVSLLDIPEELSPLVNTVTDNVDLLALLENVLLQMPYEGPIGLKNRSNLV